MSKIRTTKMAIGGKRGACADLCIFGRDYVGLQVARSWVAVVTDAAMQDVERLRQGVAV